jgi:uncharacterized protein YdaU (DUF1376 family)
MNFMPILILALFVITAWALDHDKESKSACAKTREKIRAVQAKMRSGYTRAQGEKLEARLRELRAQRKKHCR